MKRTPAKLARKKRMRQKPQNRVWTDARKKCEEEGQCRSCLLSVPLEAAHTVGREFQDETRYTARGNPYKYVPRNAVIPLCNHCHRLQHEKKISVLSLLSFSELMNAARACKKWGLDARRRLGGGREYS